MDPNDTRPMILVHDRAGTLIERPTSLDEWLPALPVGVNARNPMAAAAVTRAPYEHKGQLFANFPDTQQPEYASGPPLPNYGAPPWPLKRQVGGLHTIGSTDWEADKLEETVQQGGVYCVPGLPEYPELHK